MLSQPSLHNLSELRRIAQYVTNAEASEVVFDAARASPLPAVDWNAMGAQALRPIVTNAPPAAKPAELAPQEPLPRADIIVLAWTNDEWTALHHVFASELGPIGSDEANRRWRARWYPYRRNFYSIYPALWSRRLVSQARNRSGGAPSLGAGEWGRYCTVTIGRQSVLLFKSGLHLNQDGETLPLLQMMRQMLAETGARLVLSTGTAGGVRVDDRLGDTLLTSAAKFRLADEFSSAEFNGREFDSKWIPDKTWFEAVSGALIPVAELPVSPPTNAFGTGLTPVAARPGKIHHVTAPILTTDYFEYGTTTNGLEREGCCVEMGDAAVAMVADEKQVAYGFLRNVSDPVLNGQMPKSLQVAWAVATYLRLGLSTSFNSALATWAVIAGE